MKEQRFFVLVRLFKGWETKLDQYVSCRNVYWSMRTESNPMDVSMQTDSDYVKWDLLHQNYPLDTFQGYDFNYLLDELPFDILIKKDLSRSEMISLISELHKAIYADEVKDSEISESNIEPTYSNWMNDYKNTLMSLDKIEIPKL